MAIEPMQDEFHNRSILPDKNNNRLFNNSYSSELIVALDYPDLDDAEKLVKHLAGKVRFFKIGMQTFFHTQGIAFAKELKEQGNRVFFDAKAFDIPRTVEAAIHSLRKIKADFMSVHSMSISLLKSLAEIPRSTKLIGITLLTSVGQTELRAMGIKRGTNDVVMSLADMAMQKGKLDGLVASGKEIATLRKKYPEAILIAPGIRPEGMSTHDHKRTATPTQAIAAGADHIVVGRPITQAKDPLAQVEKILEQIDKGKASAKF